MNQYHQAVFFVVYLHEMLKVTLVLLSIGNCIVSLANALQVKTDPWSEEAASNSRTDWVRRLTSNFCEKN